jgi:Glycosyl transferase family 2
MMMIGLAALALVLAAIPALLFHANLREYRPPPAASRLPGDANGRSLSVLIPARNEERTIGAALQSVLASRGVEFEVVVLDDHSDDATADVVLAIMERDQRVRFLEGQPLPHGWCGKQFACFTLSRAARHSLLVFLDADVRLAPDGLARITTYLEESRADLVSGIPRQGTGTLVEKLVIPLIHFLLLGFLPLGRMRRYRHPAYAAGCGQLFLARRSAYEAAGGHAAIQASLHDGITLPRAFRAAGLRTDLCDMTEIATCRMYQNAGDVWRGLAKNATSGLASPGMILPATAILLGGQVLPLLLLALFVWLTPLATCLAFLAALASFYPRFAGAKRFRQSWLGAFLHPAGILIFVAIQWHALLRTAIGQPAAWKGREYQVLSVQRRLVDAKKNAAPGNHGQ